MELLIHKTVAHMLKKALHSDVNEALQKAQRAITVLQSGNRINNDFQFKVSFQIKLPTLAPFSPSSPPPPPHHLLLWE